MATEGTEPTTDATTERAGADDETELGVDPNILAALAYIFNLIGAVALLVLEDNEYVRFHAAQALLFTGAVVVAQFAVSLLGSILGIVNLGFLASLLGFAVWACAGLGFLFLAYKAFSGERYEIPVLVQYVDEIEAVF